MWNINYSNINQYRKQEQNNNIGSLAQNFKNASPSISFAVNTHLAGLAMYNSHMFRALLEPEVNILTKRLHELEAGRMMVVEGVGGDTWVEPADIIAALRTSTWRHINVTPFYGH